MKIAVLESLELDSDQLDRLNSLGEVILIPKEKTSQLTVGDFVGVDAICAEEPVSKVIYDLHDKLVSFPFVGVGWLDLAKLAANNVRVANAPGCNKDAVAEWILAMMLTMSRKLLKYINIERVAKEDFLEDMPGLAGKNVVILGGGNIGKRVGKLCEAFLANVSFYGRGDDLLKVTGEADFVVNCLARNDNTLGLLDSSFFNNLKPGAYLVSVTDAPVFELEALLASLESGHLAGAAIDPAGIPIFDASQDVYKRLRQHPGVIVTPHIAFHTNRTLRIANDMMIDNVEAWVKGQPIHIAN